VRCTKSKYGVILKLVEIDMADLTPENLTPEKIQKFFEKVAKANVKAWQVQAKFFEGLVRRNTDCFKDLTEARMTSFKEMTEAKTFTQAFEANLAFEERVREDLGALQEDGIKAWETLAQDLQALYSLGGGTQEPAATPRKKAVKKVPARKKAPANKKAPVKKKAPAKKKALASKKAPAKKRVVRKKSAAK
jgi:hypothetical protein